MTETGMASAAAQLRAEFDRSFALPPREGAADQRDFVLVSLGELEERHALHVALATDGLLSIEHVTAITPVPSRHAALLGITGLRGAVLPVFAMAQLLGMAFTFGEAWRKRPVLALVETANGQRVGLAFDRLEQFVRVAATDVFASPGTSSSGVASDKAGQSLRFQGGLYEIIEPGDVIARMVAAGYGQESIDGTTGDERP